MTLPAHCLYSYILVICHSSLAKLVSGFIPMPENVEIYVSGQHIAFYISETVPDDRTVKNIYADATLAEAKKHPAHSAAASGHVYPLQSSSDIQRGQNGDQSPLFPPKYHSPHDLPINTHGLVLSSVHSTPHSLILDFVESAVSVSSQLDMRGEPYYCEVFLLN